MRSERLPPERGLRPQHHRALLYAEVGEATETVPTSSPYLATALALEFPVLTTCRSGEARGLSRSR